MKKVYGYIRVSTVKQGTGVSLQEQKEAIVRYAEKHELDIIQWFEELETAAKQGRPLFTKMMKLLQTGKAGGVVIHKIDRSARNLKDWAAIGDLTDKGVNVYFAHESLDMDTRGGRLTADIQAVIASDYIRNLRDEAKKGLYGRLKQGVYPFGAPIGYINNGRGQLKTLDPIQGPLVKKAFHLYASGKYTLKTLTKAMRDYGLRNSKGRVVFLSTISNVLNNPFYAGIMKVKGKTFQGGHEPLVSSNTYAQAQFILRGKSNSKVLKHNFLFRRLIKCIDCGYSLIGETKKGHIYYRCHSKECPTKSVREELIENILLKSLEPVQLYPLEDQILNELLLEAQINWSETQKGIKESLNLQQGRMSQKMERLTDAYIENAIDKVLFEEKKEKLLIELQGLCRQENNIADQKEAIFKKAKNNLGLIKSFKKCYLTGIREEKREIIKTVTSDLTIQGKKLMISMRSPFYELANRSCFTSSEHDRDSPRISTPEYDENGNLLPDLVDNPALRERMKELLQRILSFFEEDIINNPDKEDENL